MPLSSEQKLLETVISGIESFAEKYRDAVGNISEPPHSNVMTYTSELMKYLRLTPEITEQLSKELNLKLEEVLAEQETPEVVETPKTTRKPRTTKKSNSKKKNASTNKKAAGAKKEQSQKAATKKGKEEATQKDLDLLSEIE